MCSFDQLIRLGYVSQHPPMHHWSELMIETMPNLTRGVSHCGLAIYIKKYLRAKEELWKLKYFIMQKHNLQKML
jgi:hypothetical protein